MLKQDFLHLVQKYPVAAAIKAAEYQEKALSSEAMLLFLLKGDAFSIADFVARAHDLGKGVVVHIDLVNGIGKDRAGIQYLHQQGIDAIITSRSHLVAAGHAEGLITIQRLLLLDHSALETGVKTIARAQPDLVEVLPGIIFPDIAQQLRDRLPGPFIAGGFIRTFADVERSYAAGAILCSSSAHELWNRTNSPPT